MRHIWNALILSVLLSAWLLPACAESVKLCDSIPAKFVGWNSSVTLPKFDPDMGTLKGVEVQCIMNLSQKIELENINSDSDNFTLSVLGDLNVTLPSSQNVSINVNYSSQGNLSGYDGVTDYSGPSGFNSSEIIPTEAASNSIPNLDGFLAVSPGESITLPVRTNIRSQFKMPGSSSAGFILKAGAQVCITYTYDAKSIEKVGNL